MYKLLLLFALVAYVYSAPGVQAPGPSEAVTNEINFKRQAAVNAIAASVGAAGGPYAYGYYGHPKGYVAPAKGYVAPKGGYYGGYYGYPYGAYGAYGAYGYGYPYGVYW